MKRTLFYICLSIQTLMCYSQINKATIKYVPLELHTTYSIPAQRFECEFAPVCKEVILISPNNINILSEAIHSLNDTIYQEKLPDKIVSLRNGGTARFFMYPQMDTRGKITTYFEDKISKTYYYSRFTIWDATEDRLYKMTDVFLNFIKTIDNYD